MERNAALSGAQFGALVVPGAHANAVSFSFTGVTLNFSGSVARIVDSDPSTFTIARSFSVRDPVAGTLSCDDNITDTVRDPACAVYADAPEVMLTVGSCFAASLPGFQIAVENNSGGDSIDFEFDFSSVTSPIFTTNVDVAMVITLDASARTVFENGGPPSTIALDNFNDRQLLVVFFDPLSASFSFIEVRLEKFLAKGISKSNVSESPTDTLRQERTLIPQEELAFRRHAAQLRERIKV